MCHCNCYCYSGVSLLAVSGLSTDKMRFLYNIVAHGQIDITNQVCQISVRSNSVPSLELLKAANQPKEISVIVISLTITHLLV